MYVQACVYILECIFLNFESVLNYQHTHTYAERKRECEKEKETMHAPQRFCSCQRARPRPCRRVETRISSMFNPKHNTTKLRTESNRVTETLSSVLLFWVSVSFPVPVTVLFLFLLVSLACPGPGLKVFHRKSSETKPKQRNNMFYTFLISFIFSGCSLRLLRCVRNRNPKN